jgi:hypothetical protein
MCFWRMARMAVFVLPSAVLTHLKAGVSTAVRPEPVRIGGCVHPASVIPETVEAVADDGADGIDTAAGQLCRRLCAGSR